MQYQRASRVALAATAGLASLSIGIAARAQEATPSTRSADATKPADTIVVTGSRLSAVGMKSPVPVTAIAADDLKKLDPSSLITGVSQLPQFYGNQTPNAGNFFTRGGYGNLNLRGLGINRTLTLLDGRRMPAASAFGGVDVNVFPSAMIRSVETVTGGASAAYGTDAVAGVVNFLLNTKYEGLELSAQAGVSSRADAGNQQVTLAFGRQVGERLHILVSGEYFNQTGVHSFAGRDWYQSWGPITGSDKVIRFYPHVVSAEATFNGVISSPNTLINSLAFDRTGNITSYSPGSPIQGAVGTPGARASTANGGDGVDLNSEAVTVYPDQQRYSIFVHAEFEASSQLKLHAQYIRGWNRTRAFNAGRAAFLGAPTALTIFQENAFLPDSLRQIMVANNIASFTLRRIGSLLDVGNLKLSDSTTQNIATGGLTWNIAGGLLKGWKVDAFYQYGQSLRDWRQLGLRVDRIFAATDAVRAPNGQVVCRVSLNPAGAATFPGCQPINLFGAGNASSAAVDYVVGYDPGQQITTPLYFADSGFARGETDSYTSIAEKVNLTTYRQHQAEVSASGNLFEDWAGPVALAVGGAWRRESIRQIVRDPSNPASNFDTYRPVMCNNAAIGLRGVSAPDCANGVGIQFSKVSNIEGAITVKEAFGELQVPLLKDSGPVTSAAANGAVRWANYSGSGTVWAYKGGLEVEFASALRFRGTYSRDVRAANLSERFDKTGGFTSIDDPRTPNVVETLNVTIFSGGNPSVRPEKADTVTAGAVFHPRFLPGLSISVDWYRVGIRDAISQLGPQQVVNRCFLQNAPEFCALVTVDPASNAIILVGNVFVNVARSKASGIDAELAYARPVHVLGGSESLGMRAFASWLLERSETDSQGNIVDYAGQVGARQSDQVYFPYPRFKLTSDLTYRRDDFALNVQGRYVGAGVQDVGPIPGGLTIADNHVPGIVYIDLRLSQAFKFDGRRLELFFNTTNLFDRSPPLTPAFTTLSGVSTQHNAQLYDVLGRRFTIGAKIKF